ncbi:MAG: sugar transferase [Bacteroidetes bacterium]|nr:sugar transferase [Bacteroidota bacterium]
MANSNTYDYRLFIRKNILIVVDTLLILLSLFLYLRFFHPTAFESYYTFTDNVIWTLAIVILWYFYAAIFDMYKISRLNKTAEIIKNTIITATLTGITYIFIPYISPTLPLNRMPAFVLIGTMVILLLIWRVVYSLVFQHPILVKRALVIGAGWTGRELVKTLTQNEKIYHNTGYYFFGFIDDDAEKQQRTIDNLKVLGGSNMLYKFVRRLKINELIMAIPEHESLKSQLVGALVDCENYGTHVSYAFYIYEEQTGKVMVKFRNNEYYLANPYRIIQSNAFYTVTNRIINVICGIIAGVIFIPIAFMIYVLNLLASRGSLFYSQERVGKNGSVFTIFKFRTMIPDAEINSGPQFASLNDPRITKIGRWLRKTRLDELPQFWNILKGEMNLIGPRPERKIFVDALSQTIPFFKLRNAVKPGLTGWAQVNHKYASDSEDSLIKLQYDLYYIKHRSFTLDLWIVLRTIGVVIKFKGT